MDYIAHSGERRNEVPRGATFERPAATAGSGDLFMPVVRRDTSDVCGSHNLRFIDTVKNGFYNPRGSCFRPRHAAIVKTVQVRI